MLRSGLRIVRRAPDEVQVGTDPRWAVRVDGLRPDEARALVALGEGVPLAVLAADEGLDPRRLAALVDQLAAAGVTAPPGGRTPTGPAGDDARVLGLLAPDAAGAARVTCRAERTVAVAGVGATGLGVAVALAAAGVGCVLVDDDRPVRSADVGPGGYRFQDVGHPRARAAVGVLAAVAPATRTEGGEVDLTVVVADDAVEPPLAALLLNRGVPHLAVVLREADTVVGPLVVPGEGPCLRCLDLHRADVDPAWPTVAATLAADAARRGGGRTPPPEPPAVVAVAAGLAAAAVLEQLDTGASPLTDATLEVGLPDALPRRRQWAVHPACGCTARSEQAWAVRRPGSCADGPVHASSGRRHHR